MHLRLFSDTLLMVVGLLSASASESSLSDSESKEWDSLSGPVASSRLILSINLEAWTTFTLLARPTQQCQNQVYGLELKQYVGRLLSHRSIAFSLTLVSKMKRFLYLPTTLSVLPPCLSIMESGGHGMRCLTLGVDLAI